MRPQCEAERTATIRGEELKPRRVFILRPDHLGDVILFSGALRHIRRRWTDAQITFCAKQSGLELLAHCPHVSRLLSREDLQLDFCGAGRLSWMPQRRGFDRLGQTARRLAPTLVRRSYRSDVALLPVLAPTTEDHRHMEFVPARIKIGIRGNHTNQSSGSDAEAEKIYSERLDASTFPWNLPELEASRRFLQFIGIPVSADELWPEFWTRAEHRATAEKLLASRQGRKLLGLAPGVGWPKTKQLPADWYGRVVRTTGLAHVDVAILGGATDQLACAELEACLRHALPDARLVNLAGRTTILELVECIRLCDVLLLPDAAPLHIATALRRPVVGVMGGGHFGRFYPWGDPNTARVVNQPMDCYGCNWQCRFATVRCVQEIAPEAAARELWNLVQRTAPAAPLLCRS